MHGTPQLRFEVLPAWPAGPTGAALRDLHALIFEHPAITETELAGRLSTQQDVLIQLVWAQPALVAYKIGHQRKAGHFYSWLGGVHPDWRGQGIAAGLMREQHAWCRAQGYARIRTHTSNRFRAMLILNLKHGFDIVGHMIDERDQPKLILEKALSSAD